MAEKEKPEKRPKGKPRGRKGFGTPSLEKHCTATKSEISEILSHSTYWFGATKVRNAEEMAERLNQFFARCNETGEIPSVEKMALALGINAKLLWAWQQGDGATPEMADMIKQAKAILASVDAELVQRRKIPETTYIFRSKNYYGMKDQQEVVVKPRDPMGDTGTPEELAAKYRDSIEGPKVKATIEGQAAEVQEPATLPEKTEE